MPPEARECIERIALGIFTDMVNSGATLQETLAAVYLSGSENALAAYRETPNDDVKRADLVGTKTLQIDGEEYALAGYCRDA